MDKLSNQFANTLENLGVGRGKPIAGFVEPCLELYSTILGTWKAGCVYVPLFTLFGPRAVEVRLNDCRAKVVVTDDENRNKLDEADLEFVEHVMVKGERYAENVKFKKVYNASYSYDTVRTGVNDLAILQYTSGTTGPPKGARQTHKLLVPSVQYIKYAVDLRQEEEFWGATSPAWAYGLYLSTAAPLALGKTVTAHRGKFEPELFMKTLDEFNINNLATAPTVWRTLAASGVVEKHDVELRAANSAGEPLDEETIRWSKENFGTPIMDQYGLTEFDMFVNNYNAFEGWEVRPMSMGRPLPGFRASIIDDEGNEVKEGKSEKSLYT